MCLRGTGLPADGLRNSALTLCSEHAWFEIETSLLEDKLSLPGDYNSLGEIIVLQAAFSKSRNT